MFELGWIEPGPQQPRGAALRRWSRGPEAELRSRAARSLSRSRRAVRAARSLAAAATCGPAGASAAAAASTRAPGARARTACPPRCAPSAWPCGGPGRNLRICRNFNMFSCRFACSGQTRFTLQFGRVTIFWSICNGWRSSKLRARAGRSESLATLSRQRPPRPPRARRPSRQPRPPARELAPAPSFAGA